MENETLLEVLNSQKIWSDSTASGIPEDHDYSDHIDTVLGETIENDQNEENEDEDNTGVVIRLIVELRSRSRSGPGQVQVRKVRN